MDWGKITALQNSQAMLRADMRSSFAIIPFTPEEKKEILNIFRQAVLLMNKDPKAWAHRLREREQNGEILSLYQRKTWRDALGVEYDFA